MPDQHLDVAIQSNRQGGWAQPDLTLIRDACRRRQGPDMMGPSSEPRQQRRGGFDGGKDDESGERSRNRSCRSNVT